MQHLAGVDVVVRYQEYVPMVLTGVAAASCVDFHVVVRSTLDGFSNAVCIFRINNCGRLPMEPGGGDIER